MSDLPNKQFIEKLTCPSENIVKHSNCVKLYSVGIHLPYLNVLIGPIIIRVLSQPIRAESFKQTALLEEHLVIC